MYLYETSVHKPSSRKIYHSPLLFSNQNILFLKLHLSYYWGLSVSLSCAKIWEFLVVSRKWGKDSHLSVVMVMSTSLVVPNSGALHSAGLGTLGEGAEEFIFCQSAHSHSFSSISTSRGPPPQVRQRSHLFGGSINFYVFFYKRNLSLVSCSDCTLPVYPGRALYQSSGFWDPKSRKGVSLTLFCFPCGI